MVLNPLIQDALGLVPQAVITGLLMGMAYALVAAGLALIWGVVDIVNFAHGEYMLVAMYVTLVGANDFGIDPLLLVPLNAVLLFAAGYVTYRLVIARVMDAPMLAQIFATFGILLIIRFGALYLAGPYTVSVEEFVFSGHSTVGGIVLSHPETATAVVSVVTLTLLFLFMKRTKTGKAIRATSQDWEAARVVGIDPDRVNAITWGIGIAAVGVAGTMVATFFPTQPELTPTTWTLIAFASVALGGFGSVMGAVVGGLGISLVEHLGATLLNPSFKELYVFLVFIGALVWRAEGGFNWRARR
ncbi:branched-chain amino acid ABC transporter permease [Halorussus salinisoli]|uniref:branched-chain amino acid ABC transporter permease n=1 Tax=Halorussus salinisoli TaxID=2558242 RepID=UPI0010C2283C|nr:branched-chain amino acid ABC transporter permease [Halorussus salinisoli]